MTPACKRTFAEVVLEEVAHQTDILAKGDLAARAAPAHRLAQVAQSAHHLPHIGTHELMLLALILHGMHFSGW